MINNIKRINGITAEQIITAGYDFSINHEDFFVAVQPLANGKGRIVYAETTFFLDNAWYYDTFKQAFFALAAWDPVNEKEPMGWIYIPVDGRCRPDGDPKREYLRL